MLGAGIAFKIKFFYTFKVYLISICQFLRFREILQNSKQQQIHRVLLVKKYNFTITELSP